MACLSAYVASTIVMLSASFMTINSRLLWCFMTCSVATVGLMSSRFNFVNIMSAVYAYIVCHCLYRMNESDESSSSQLCWKSYFTFTINSILCALFLMPMQACLSYGGQESHVLIFVYFVLLYFFTAMITLDVSNLKWLSALRSSPTHLFVFFLITNCIFALILMPSNTTILLFMSPFLFFVFARYKFLNRFI